MGSVVGVEELGEVVHANGLVEVNEVDVGVVGEGFFANVVDMNRGRGVTLE